jgi:3-hydroxyacyl-CoA dehydrogenase
MSEFPVVRLEKDGEIGVIIVNYPPVNALGPGVSEGIIASLNQANADGSIKAMVLIGDGRSFIAGADIRGFGTGRKRAPIGERTYDVLDASPKPVVAAIHGFALGGGLENAMACHYRVAVASAKVGLPEVLIGILPGGGGTQRLPRLAGARTALEMITSGRHVPAPEAVTLGIIDEVIPEGTDLREAAVAYARRVAGFRPLPRVRDKTVSADPGIFDAMRKSIARKARNQMAPYHCIAAVEAACRLPFDDGIRREAELFAELESSDEAKALRYAFSPNGRSPSCLTCRLASLRSTSRRPLSLARALWVAASPCRSPISAMT